MANEARAQCVVLTLLHCLCNNITACITTQKIQVQYFNATHM